MNTTQSTHHTEITASSESPTITIVRDFDAPRDLVFRAWTEKDLIERWLGPGGLEMETHRYDCRTGGSYAYTHRDADSEYEFFGSFHEVRRPDRLVQTFTFGGFPESVSLDTMTLTELPGGGTRCTTTSLFDSYQARDGMLASGMDVGVKDGYRKLDSLLQEMM